MRALPALLRQAGYEAAEAIIVGLRQHREPPLFHAQGLTPATVVYAASLAKQMTAALVALLAPDGVLDVDGALSGWLPELPRTPIRTRATSSAWPRPPSGPPAGRCPSWRRSVSSRRCA
ncbi:serine hydrolase [[Actinomadura] parvosata]|uniref:serine hydrolase n=1 Tax=[Actinomadura] parvosata TaxID=1955412 RepID=UPI00406C8FE0